MPYIELGTTDQLKLKIPTNGSTNWGNVVKTDLFQRLVEHDHSGNGKGVKLGAGSLEDDSITGVKFRLSNDEYLRARNVANDGDVNILKVDINDDVIMFPALIESTKSATLTDDTSILTSAGIITLLASKTCTIMAKITRGAETQKIIIEMIGTDSIIQEYSGDDLGADFDNVSGELQYTLTATGDDATITYVIIKE